MKTHWIIIKSIILALVLLGSVEAVEEKESRGIEIDQEAILKANQWRQTMIMEVLNEPHKIQERVELAIQRYFKDPEFIEIKFYPTPQSKLAQGFFQRIDVRTRKAKVKVLKIEEGNFRFKGLTIKLANLYRDGRLRIDTVDDTDFYFKISEKSINDAVFEKKLPLRNPKLQILPGQLYFRASFKTLFFKSHVETKGRLEVRNKTKIYFYPDRLKLNSLPIPGFVKNSLTHKINPIIDLDDFSLVSNVDSIKLENGFIEFKG